MLLKIKNKSFNLSIDNNVIVLITSLAQLELISANQLDLVVSEYPFLVRSSYKYNHNALVISYYLSNKQRLLIKSKLCKKDVLKFLVNIEYLINMNNQPYLVHLAPANLCLDDNLFPYLIYRGYNEFVYPYQCHEANLIKEYQCLVIALLYGYDFYELFDNEISLKYNDDIIEILQANTIDEIVFILNKKYQYRSKNLIMKVLLILSCLMLLMWIRR